MKLTEKDKQVLLKLGHCEADFMQIQDAASRCLYYDHGRITQKEVIARLGRFEWISGISRAAFHYTTERYGISFDCSRIFQDNGNPYHIVTYHSDCGEDDKYDLPTLSMAIAFAKKYILDGYENVKIFRRNKIVREYTEFDGKAVRK